MKRVLVSALLTWTLTMFTVPKTNCLPRRMMNVTTFSPVYTEFTSNLTKDLYYRYMKIDGDKVFIGTNGYLFTQKLSNISVQALAPLEFKNEVFTILQFSILGVFHEKNYDYGKANCRDSALLWRSGIKDFLCQNWVTEVYHFDNSSLFPNNDSYLICNSNAMTPYYKIYNISNGKFQEVDDLLYQGSFNHGPRCQFNPAPYDFNLCESFKVTNKSIYPHDDILTYCNTDLRSGHLKYSITSLGYPFLGRLPINHSGAPPGTPFKKSFSFRRTDYVVDGIDSLHPDHFLKTYPIPLDDKYIFTFHEATARETKTNQEFFSVYPYASSVCMMDDGFNTGYYNTEVSSDFKTLISTRLVCRSQGFGDIILNEAWDIKRHSKHPEMVYILFSTRIEEFHDVGMISGVCLFNLSKIIEIQETSIRRDFKNGGAPEEWGAKPYQWKRKRCTEIEPHFPENSAGHDESAWISNHRVTVENAYAEHNIALVTTYDTQYESMVIDPHGDYNLFYFATANGEIHKVLQYYKRIYDMTNRQIYATRSNVLQRWTPFLDTGYHYQIWYLDIALNGSYVYAANDKRVVQIKTDGHCNEYEGCANCALDPHCGWDTTCQCCVSHVPGVTRQDIYDQLSGNIVCKTCDFVDGDSSCDLFTSEKAYTYQNETVNATQGEQSFFRLKAPKYIQCPRVNQTVWEKKSGDTYEMLGPNGDRHHINWNLDLIVTSVTAGDAGTYRLVCVTTRTKIPVKTYNVNVSGCSYSTATEYQQKYQQWCDAFDDYKKEMNKWKQCQGSCCPSP